MTFVSVPPIAVTVMPADGSAWVAPFAGVIVTFAAVVAPGLDLPVAVTPPVGPGGLEPPCPPPVHAAASTVTVSATATPANLPTPASLPFPAGALPTRRGQPGSAERRQAPGPGRSGRRSR